MILPMHGIKSRTTLYRVIYSATRPIWPLLRLLGPKWVTTTERVGKAMITVAERGAPTRFLENADINAISRESPNPA
jgi:hypothetical protein